MQQAHQEHGMRGGPRPPQGGKKPMYGHGFATLFLAEVYGTSSDRTIREHLVRAVELIVRSLPPQVKARAENSAAADSRNISIEVHEDLHKDLPTASVSDDGRGMDAETAKNVQDPF